MTRNSTRSLLARLFTCLALSGTAAALAAPAAAPGVTVAALNFPCSGTSCSADLYLPAAAAKAAGERPPVVVMAHGFGGQKEWALPPYAKRFAEAGMAVLLFDYRGFGLSGGQPRYVVDASKHVQDWLAAIAYVRSRPDLDGGRIGLWGTSYSGGQVLDVGQRNPEGVRAISAQVPFVSGLSSSWLYPKKYLPKATWLAVRDLLRNDNEEPLYIETINKDGGFAALICPECGAGYAKLVPPGTTSPNKVAARIMMTLPLYEPGRHADRIQASVLIMAAERDGLIPIDAVRSVAKKIPHAEFVELKGADHFAPYNGPLWEQVVAKQTAFFAAALKR